MMKRYFALAIGAALGSATPLLAQQPPAAATVVTLGEAVIRMPPDRAIVTLMTESRGQTPQEAQAKGTQAMKTVQQAVDKLKLAGAQVMTTGLSLSADYDFANNQRTMRGYVDRHSIVVRLDDTSRAGELLSAAVGAGATSVSGIRFDRRDREALEEQALKQAVQIARARANALAAGAGREIARVVKIAEEQAENVSRAADLRAAQVMVGGGLGGGAVPVASGEIEIRVRVLLTVALK